MRPALDRGTPPRFGFPPRAFASAQSVRERTRIQNRVVYWCVVWWWSKTAEMNARMRETIGMYVSCLQFVRWRYEPPSTRCIPVTHGCESKRSHHRFATLVVMCFVRQKKCLRTFFSQGVCTQLHELNRGISCERLHLKYHVSRPKDVLLQRT